MQNRANKKLEKKFKDYFGIGEAISTLLFPYAEVVLHDTASGHIVKIWNAFSKRKAGDLSHLEGAPDLFTEDRVLGPYEKALPAQARTKSITAALYDDAGAICGFFCVNLNITVIDQVTSTLAAFTALQTQRPPPIYLNDLEQRINYLVRDYLLSINKTMANLSRTERAGLVRLVDSNGLLQARNAIQLVAKALGVSRGSVYNLLAASRADGTGAAEPPDTRGLSKLAATAVGKDRRVKGS